MNGRIIVFLVVMFLAVIRGLLQRSRVQRKIEERNARGLVSMKNKRTSKRVASVPETQATFESSVDSDEVVKRRS